MLYHQPNKDLELATLKRNLSNSSPHGPTMASKKRKTRTKTSRKARQVYLDLFIVSAVKETKVYNNPVYFPLPPFIRTKALYDPSARPSKRLGKGWKDVENVKTIVHWIIIVFRIYVCFNKHKFEKDPRFHLFSTKTEWSKKGDS